MNELNTEWEIEKDIEIIIDSQDENFHIKKQNFKFWIQPVSEKNQKYLKM